MVTNRHRDGKRREFRGFPWAVVFDFSDFAPPVPPSGKKIRAKNT
jgi:hypothetical protein